MKPENIAIKAGTSLASFGSVVMFGALFAIGAEVGSVLTERTKRLLKKKPNANQEIIDLQEEIWKSDPDGPGGEEKSIHSPG